MTNTEPLQEESPTCTVRHFSTNADDDLVGGKTAVIARHKLGEWQAKGFAEIGPDGKVVDDLPDPGEIETPVDPVPAPIPPPTPGTLGADDDEETN